MKKTFYFLAALTLGFTACNKKDKVEPQPEPIATATMTRSLDFPLLGIKKDTAYTTANKIIAEAGYADLTATGTGKNMFYLLFKAGPHVNNTAGDAILFHIEKTKLRAGFVGAYTLNPQETNGVYNTRYVYAMYDERGGYKGSISETSMGLGFAGEVVIESYNAFYNTVSGHYTTSAHLNGDPTKPFTYFDPNNKCDLTITGTFTNVKIKSE